MRSSIALVLLLLLAAPGAHAQGDPKVAARKIITSQIEAMARDDAAAAYGFAAPEIRMLYPSPDHFMAMVKKGYAAVVRPSAYDFAEAEVIGTRLVRQVVEITAADGSSWTAEYYLSQQADGSLKISGCRLLKRDGIGA